MKSDMISTRIDHETKIEFTRVCEEIGLSSSQAIKLFAQAVVSYGGIPFELKRKQPNKATIEAMEQLEEGKGHKANSLADLFKEFNIDINNA